MKGLDLHIQAGGTPLSFLQPFVENIFSNVNGSVHGDVRLFGPFSQLDLEGKVKAQMQMKVNILNATFLASADSVHIASGLFRFQNVRLQDTEGHTGLANGELRHTKLKNLSYQSASIPTACWYFTLKRKLRNSPSTVISMPPETYFSGERRTAER